MSAKLPGEPARLVVCASKFEVLAVMDSLAPLPERFGLLFCFIDRPLFSGLSMPYNVRRAE